MIIQGTGPYFGPPGFDRGMQTTRHCGNDPESWVRGSASLDTSNGAVSMTIQLETDSTLAGPKGKVIATVRDASGASLGTVTTPEIGIGGKLPGGAKIENFSASGNIGAAAAQNAKTLTLEAQCLGSVPAPFGVNLGDVFQLLIAIFGGSGASPAAATSGR